MPWRLIDEAEFASMKRVLLTIPNILQTETRLCAYVGGRCDMIHLVDVPVLPGRSEIYDAADLEVTLWIPNYPYLIHNFTDLTHNCACIHLDPGNGNETVVFHLVHYDQRVMISLDSPATTTNVLLQHILGRQVVWHGEILIIKTLPSGRVLNFDTQDIGLLRDILASLVDNHEWIDSDSD